MEQSTSQEVNSHSARQKIVCIYVEPERSLSPSLEPFTGP